MFLGVTSSRSSGPSCCRRQRLRSATATAFFASSWPTICSLSAATIAFGVSLSFSTSEASPPFWGMDAWMFISPTMLEALRAASSRTGQGGEEAVRIIDDAGDRLRVGSRVPPVEIESAAEQDSVGPREHIAGAAGERILDFGLRLQDRELPARRVQV